MTVYYKNKYTRKVYSVYDYEKRNTSVILITLSHYHPITQLPYHTITLSHYYHITLSHYYLITLLPYHTIILLPMLSASLQ